jgi:hypothetical protein
MNLSEAIKHCLEVAEQNEFETRVYDELNKPGNEEYRNSHCQCAADHRQLAEWLRELKEAKRLLGEALRTLNDGSCNKDCRQCKWNENGCEMSCRFAWRYGDEVSALIGDENDAE